MSVRLSWDLGLKEQTCSTLSVTKFDYYSMFKRSLTQIWYKIAFPHKPKHSGGWAIVALRKKNMTQQFLYVYVSGKTVAIGKVLKLVE